jgi:hypothetical protein
MSVENTNKPQAIDGIKVRLLEGNTVGQIGEEVVLSTSVAQAAIAAGQAEEVTA